MTNNKYTTTSNRNVGVPRKSKQNKISDVLCKKRKIEYSFSGKITAK